MSRGQDYFPPKGTKFKWENKALDYSPWYCNLSGQKEPKLWLFPLYVNLTVDYHEKTGMFNWTIDVCDFVYNHTILSGCNGTALKACLIAEKIGEVELKKHLPRWVKTALANKWRPPCPTIR